MKDVSVNDGRTVLFVSHNLPAVSALCDRGLYLKNGLFESIGLTSDILSSYKRDVVLQDNVLLKYENDYTKLLNFESCNSNGDENIEIGDEVVLKISFECKKANKSLALSFNIYNDEDLLMFEAFVPFANEGNSEVKTYEVKILIPAFNLEFW